MIAEREMFLKVEKKTLKVKNKKTGKRFKDRLDS